MSRARCVGCDEPLIAASREHILPDWLAKEVFIPNAQLKQYRRDEDSQKEDLLRAHGLNNFVVKNVCENCNNGWMSLLENNAKPFILELMNEGETLKDFAHDGKLALSRWAVKTAFMIASAQQNQISLPWHLFTNMRSKENNGPDACYVFVGQVFAMNQGFTYACLSDHRPSDEKEIVQLRVGFSIKRIHLVTVIPVVEAERVMLIDPRMHRPLWPPDIKLQHRLCYPPSKIATLREAQFFVTNLIQAGLIEKAGETV
jgi:hypothetical protein